MGQFYVSEPEHRLAPLPPLVGPTVRLGKCTRAAWVAVVFCASRDSQVELTYRTNTDSQARPVHAEYLAEHCGWHFLRWTITVPVDVDKVLLYTLHLPQAEATSAVPTNLGGEIPIAGATTDWELVAYSCYDQRRAIGEALWRDVAARAKDGTRPVHAILGGGDQLYNDNVWALDSLAGWLKRPIEERLACQPDKAMQAQVSEFYLGSYLRTVHFHPAAEFLRNTPQVNTYDDHDIFDGWGSYPDQLQDCPVFSMIFQEAQRFYLLFQHMMSPQVADADGYIVNPAATPGGRASYSFATQLGPSLAVVAPDSRSQRSRARILPEAVLQRCIAEIDKFDASTEHVIWLSAIPVLYPSLGVLEKLLKYFATKSAESMLFKTGLYDNVMNHFGQPDLLDDVTDHWSSQPHEEEKGELLTALRDVAARARVRVTLVSGDVHLAAVGSMRSAGKAGQVQACDPGFMTQIVTSGIGNNPPGDAVVKYIHSCVKQGRVVAPGLLESMGTMFRRGQTTTGSRAFNNRQNVCELGVRRDAAGGAASLHFRLIMLGGDPVTGTEVGDRVWAAIPPLLPPGAPQQQALALEMEEARPVKKGCAPYCCIGRC